MDLAASDAILRTHVPELTLYSGLTDKAGERMLSLAKAGFIPEQSFRFFSSGGVVRQLSASRFAEWIDFLLGTGSQPSAACAVELCHFYYLMVEPRVGLPTDLLFRVLTAPPLFTPIEQRRSATQEDYNWTKVACAYIDEHPDRAVELASLMLEHFRENGTIVGSFHSQTNRVLDQVLKRDPAELWRRIAAYLGPPIDSRAFHIYHWLRDGALSLIPAEPVWNWVEEDVDKRAWYVAQFVPQVFPGGANAVSAREVLVRYGDRKDVRNNLRANFSTETWSGPESSHARQKLDKLTSWKQGETNTNVLQWLNDYIDSVERRVERAKVEEEREF